VQAEARRKHRDVQEEERALRKEKTRLVAQLAALRKQQQQSEQATAQPVLGNNANASSTGAQPANQTVRSVCGTSHFSCWCQLHVCARNSTILATACSASMWPATNQGVNVHAVKLRLPPVSRRRRTTSFRPPNLPSPGVTTFCGKLAPSRRQRR
jgi:hypothetical protein